jgi:4-hydroxy-tetrahydrodipicolinate synthase
VVDAGVDSLGILGSTGTRISPLRRAHITRCAVEHANALPVMVSIGALRLV